MATIAENLSRIQSAKADIKTAIEAKGVTVPSSATIDTYDDYVSQISTSSSIPANYTVYEIDSDWGTPTNFTLKDTVTQIANNKFSYISTLSAATLTSGVTTIGNYAFSNNPALCSVNIPSSVTKLGNSIFYYVGTNYNAKFDVSNINLTNVVYNISYSFSSLFAQSVVYGSLTIPSNMLSGSSSGYSSPSYAMFDNTKIATGETLNIDVYADGEVIPRNMFNFTNTGTQGTLNLVIHGSPTFLSQTCISSIGTGKVTFLDCTTPPNAPVYTSSSTSPFYKFGGTLYVPAIAVSAWKSKYGFLSSQIQAIPT